MWRVGRPHVLGGLAQGALPVYVPRMTVGGAKKNVPGHPLALGISIALTALSIGAAVAGEREPASLMVGLGVGTMFGASVVATLVRRAEAWSVD